MASVQYNDSRTRAVIRKSLMKKLFVAILAAGLVFMAGCSSEPVKPTTAGTPQPKAPEAITGSSAFFKCYVSARIWAPDAQPYRAESHPEAESKGRDGKAAGSRERLYRRIFAGGEVALVESRASPPGGTGETSAVHHVIARSLRFSQPVQRNVCILGKWTLRKNLEVLLVVFPRLGFISQFLLANGKTEAGQGVAILVVESFFVTFECGFVVLALEVEVPHLDVFQRLHRIPGMKLLNAGNFNVVGDVEIFDGCRAVRLGLGVVFRRADIDSSLAAGAFLSLAIAGGSPFRRRLGRGRFARGILCQRNGGQRPKKNNRESSTPDPLVSRRK